MEGMIFESELKVLEILWTEGDMFAKDLAYKLKKSTNWEKTTSYTIFKKCVEKGLIERSEPNFMCRAIITRKEAKEREVGVLTDKMFGGSSDSLIASLLGRNNLTPSQINTLRSLAQEFAGDHV